MTLTQQIQSRYIQAYVLEALERQRVTGVPPEVLTIRELTIGAMASFEGFRRGLYVGLGIGVFIAWILTLLAIWVWHGMQP